MLRQWVLKNCFRTVEGKLTEARLSLMAAVYQGAIFQVPPGNFISVTLDHLLPVCPNDPETCRVLVMSLFVLCPCGADRVSYSVTYLYVTKIACICLVRALVQQSRDR